MVSIKNLKTEELEAGLDKILQSPKDNGMLDLIVRRPLENQREVLQEGQLNLLEGLVGDNWKVRGSSQKQDWTANREVQLTLMNSRVIALIAQDKERWSLAGDQLYVDMDLSAENMPPGTRLEIGDAVIEVTAQPHTGCKKFVARFGLDAMMFVNSAVGKQLHLRGINTKIIQPGAISVGDVVRKI